MGSIFCQQALDIKQEQNKSSLDFWMWIIKSTQLITLALILVGFSFLGQQTAQAETARIDDITIDRQPDETYDSLIQRAELAATAALQQGFDRGSQITDVSVVILGQNQGVIAPVLAIDMSRPKWNTSTNEFTYFNSARNLLRLEEQQLATADRPTSPGTTPPPPSRPQQSNSNPPGSAREIINNTPVQPINPAPSATPIPGSPALVPTTSVPGTPTITSPSSNFNSTNTPVTPASNTPNLNSTPTNTPVIPETTPNTQNLSPTPTNTLVSPETTPNTQNLPQVAPSSSTPN